MRGHDVSEDLLETLLAQAWMFDDPSAYAAGVRDTWDAWKALPGVEDGVGRAGAA